MVVGVADTHTAIWYLFNDERLSSAARGFMEDAAAQGKKIALSSISLAEVVYLSEKGRLAPGTYEELMRVVSQPTKVFQEVSPSLSIINSMRLVSRQSVPDLPDRLIAATAVYLGVPLLSRDSLIRASSVHTIW